MLLTSDNTLRILNINSSQASNGPYGIGQNPDQSIPLSSSSINNCKQVTSGLGVKESLGETAIGFTYGPPLGSLTHSQRRRHLSGGTYSNWEEDKENGRNQAPIYWPIFCLYGNGNVYSFLTGLGDNAIYQPDIIGPLPMFPHADDNYEPESNGSYKAILCLHPAHSAAPPILITATSSTVYHAIILHNQLIDQENGEHSDTESCTGSDWSSSVFGRIKNNKRAPPNLSLHVYESLELSSALTEQISQNADALSSKNNHNSNTDVKLESDPSTPSRYFCCHSAGIHGVTLPMVNQLKQMAQDDEFEGKNIGVTNLSEEDSSLEHLIATKPGPSNIQTSSSIVGMSVVTFPPPTRLICMMNTYSVEVLPLSMPYFDVAANLLTEGKLILLLLISVYKCSISKY